MTITQTEVKRSSLGVSLSLYLGAVKPGIVVSNTLTAAAAYVFAATRFEISVFIGLVLGTALVIASGCVVNNYYDRHIDAKMERTAGRGQATGEITGRGSFVYSLVLGLAGLLALLALTDPWTAALGVFAWLMYSVVYTQAKHRTVHATLIGTVPGAIPPLAGVIASDTPNLVDALGLFIVLVAWQIVHFYAISIRRFRDYEAANVPVPALAYGIVRTKRLMLVGAVAFLLSVLALGFFGTAGIVLTAALGAYALFWLILTAIGQPKSTKAGDWANSVFWHSLGIICLLCALLVLDPVLP